MGTKTIINGLNANAQLTKHKSKGSVKIIIWMPIPNPNKRQKKLSCLPQPFNLPKIYPIQSIVCKVSLEIVASYELVF